MKDQDEQEPQGSPRPRRTYAAPAVIDSATFETLALSCTKTSGALELICTSLPGGALTDS